MTKKFNELQEELDKKIQKLNFYYVLNNESKFEEIYLQIQKLQNELDGVMNEVIA